MSSERTDATVQGTLGYMVLLALATAVMLGGQSSLAQGSAADSPTGFPPLDQWKAGVLAGDASALKAFYSTDPVAQVMANGVKTDTDADVNFWLGLKARSISLETVAVLDRPEGTSVVFKADVQLANGQILSVTDGQMWRKEGEQWRLMSVERADAPHLKQPSDMKKNIYPADADAHAEIKEAEEKAAAGHKRVVLVFGANWCYDCHVLDLAFHRPDFAAVMASYEVVHVDLGPDEMKNADLVKEFDVPLNKGIPALAVIESDGKLVVSQKNGEFEDARSMTPEAVVEFLNKWKPEAR
ncbi:MAG TPA: thioredoxin family protein [Candidatus Sulfotelmatobacter sp.]|nr:thioredoxin family protein [Candidatus Sulfotelmatobacter sp.]